MARVSGLVGLILLLSFHLPLYQQTFAAKQRLDSLVKVNYVLPTEFSRIAALDFQGLAADFQLLEAIFFIGDKIERQENVSAAEWDYFTQIIHAVIKLDPYFYDTYYLASGMLTWGAGRFHDAIAVLEVASENNPDNYRFPFRIGFIYFYFLNNPHKGAEYIAAAARIPGAPPLYASLASRLSYYAGEYQVSIQLLKEMLQNTRDEWVRRRYLKRLAALEGALQLEQALNTYQQKFGSFPEEIQALVDAKVLDRLPIEPYGGAWIMVENGRVYSTSKFADAAQAKED